MKVLSIVLITLSLCWMSIFSQNNITSVSMEPIYPNSDDTIFVAPAMNIKKEKSDEDFQAGLNILDDMDDSIFKRQLKNERMKKPLC